MSKTNDTSRPATLDDHRPLADSELDAVSGGFGLLGGIPGAGPSAPKSPSGGGGLPGLNNMIADKIGDVLGQAIDKPL